MKKRLLVVLLVVLSLSPLAINVISPVAGSSYQLAGSATKIGFSWVNGMGGSSELLSVGYDTALSMGAQIEHRDYGWRDIMYNYPIIFEWTQIYLSDYPQLDTSIAVSVISNNYTYFRDKFNFERYTNTTEADLSGITRFNDPEVIDTLIDDLGFVIDAFDDLDYVSIGSEINVFFEQYFDNDTKTMKNTAMLNDYVELCEAVYDFVKLNYSDVQVLTIFRAQRDYDLDVTEAIIDNFNDTCDIYGVSGRIATTFGGSLDRILTDRLIERYEDFSALCGPKNFAITNIYTVSDSRSQGSESYQANMVKSFFALVDHFSNLEFICWYTLYDYPFGYLGMAVNIFQEVHSTAGLLTQSGNKKIAYYTWINLVRERGRISAIAGWEIAIGAIALTVIAGLVIFVFVKDAIATGYMEDEKQATPKEITFGITDEDEEKKKKRQKRRK